MHLKRILVALVAIPILAVVIIWLPAEVFLFFLGTAAVLACHEFLQMTRAAGFSTGRWVPLVCAAGLLAAAWTAGVVGFTGAVLAIIVLLPTARLGHQEAPAGSMGGVACEYLAVFLVAATAACFGWIRLWPGDELGIRLVLFFLVCVWVGDSGAFYVGRSLGRHKMSPRISPNKTFEGLAGGIAATFVAAFVMRWLLGLDLAPIHVAALAAILAAAGPLGDLVESLFKRDSGVKDSSSMLPGHGGFLDRTDSLFYPAPAVLAYLFGAGLL
jgi:phosphatidate cytidylyltransferase